MSWKVVTMSERRRRFIEDYQLNYYFIPELSGRSTISRKTTYTHPCTGVSGSIDSSSIAILAIMRYLDALTLCPWQTDQAIAKDLVILGKAHPRRKPRKLLDLIRRR